MKKFSIIFLLICAFLISVGCAHDAQLVKFQAAKKSTVEQNINAGAKVLGGAAKLFGCYK